MTATSYPTSTYTIKIEVFLTSNTGTYPKAYSIYWNVDINTTTVSNIVVTSNKVIGSMLT